MLESIEGLVERITFFNPENGYTVLRLAPAGRSTRPDELVTVVGNMPEVNPGERLRLHGRWATHPTYGRQFQAEHCEQLLPATVEGIRRYLGSGLIKGIGPRTASKIVNEFGAETLYVIDNEPHRLREVPDIGPTRYALITDAWEAQKAIKEVMVFLQGHGVTTGLAVKIYKQYGDASIPTVQADPYRLARDIWGVGFKTADKIAMALGLPADSASRQDAGVAYALSELANEGHTHAPAGVLLDTAAELLGLPAAGLAPALGRLAADGRIRRDQIDSVEAIYLTPFYQAETGVARRLKTLLSTPGKQLQTLLSPDRDLGLSDEQLAAVQMALSSKVSVLTGGPGTGKTFSVQALIAALEVAGRSYALASPTGRAAKRLSEATGRPAATLHRLLGYKPDGTFAYDESESLKVDMLVVDETSMLDLLLANNLLKALDPRAHLLLVGDVDQLPSVGAGNVLRDLIDSGVLPVTRLTRIFRQAEESLIVQNAHRIIHGEMPTFPKTASVFFLFTQDDPVKAADWVVEVVAKRIPARFGMDPLRDVQVLSPMHRGETGVRSLNERLQAALNPAAPGKPEKAIGGRVFRPGDRVMQLRNNYHKQVFNGDIGRVSEVDLEMQALAVDFEGETVFYDWSETDELTHAYCASVHKAQGSEYTAVVLALLPQHYMLLQRNLLYTAVTRARQLCVIVGNRKAIAMAVRNAKVARRYSGLRERLTLPGSERSGPG